MNNDAENEKESWNWECEEKYIMKLIKWKITKTKSTLISAFIECPFTLLILMQDVYSSVALWTTAKRDNANKNKKKWKKNRILMEQRDSVIYWCWLKPKKSIPYALQSLFSLLFFIYFYWNLNCSLVRSHSSKLKCRS